MFFGVAKCVFIPELPAALQNLQALRKILNQYDQMAGQARTIKGISVNDIPEMRKAFDGMAVETTEITYTIGGADWPARRSELIIRNF